MRTKRALMLVTAALLLLPASRVAAQEVSKVVLYGPKRFTGSGLTPSVYVDDRQVFRLDNGRFVSLALAPGKHKLTSSMKHAPLVIDVEAGSTSYIEMVILTGNWRGGGRLLPVDEPDAVEVIKKLKPLDAKWIFAHDMVWGSNPKPDTGPPPARVP